MQLFVDRHLRSGHEPCRQLSYPPLVHDAGGSGVDQIALFDINAGQNVVPTGLTLQPIDSA